MSDVFNAFNPDGLVAGDRVRAASGCFKGKTGAVEKVSYLGVLVLWDNSFGGVSLFAGPKELKKIKTPKGSR
jgi:hypothetical protein